MKVFTADRIAPSEFSTPTSYKSLQLRHYNLRADNAIVNSGKRLFQPEWVEQVSFVPILVMRMERVAKSVQPMFAERYVGQCKLGCLLQWSLSPQLPQHLASSLDNSLILANTDWRYLESMPQGISITQVLGTEPPQMQELTLPYPSLHHLASQVVLLSHYYLLKVGDLMALPLASHYTHVPCGTNVIIGEDGAEIIYFGIQ